MANYSLVPVDYQPDFSNVSLVSVDHDPFAGEDATQHAQNQQTQKQLAQSQPPVAIVDAPNAGAPMNSASASEAGESRSPDAENVQTSQPDPSQAPPSAPNSVPFTPFGELKPATFTPTQRIGNLAADAGIALVMQPYVANDLAKRIGNILGWTTLGAAGSALDFADAAGRHDLPGALAATAGVLPGTRGIARGIAEEAGAGLRKLTQSPEILSEELVGRTRSQIRDLAASKGLVPKGDPLHPDYPRRWNDPTTNEERLRLDRGHVSSKTGRPFDIPNAAVDHVHAYDVDGNPIIANDDRHIPTEGE